MKTIGKIAVTSIAMAVAATFGLATTAQAEYPEKTGPLHHPVRPGR